MEEKVSLLNLHGIGPTENTTIEFNKMCSDMMKKISEEQFFNECQLCKNKNIKFCKSHTIPRFILKNIAKNGHLYNTQVLNTTPFINPENGINNTQIFQSICAECDSQIFKDYENELNYTNKPTQKMLKQIALKNHLFGQFKLNRDVRKLKYAKNKLTQESSSFLPNRIYKNEVKGIQNLIRCNSLDMQFHEKNKNKIFETLNSNNELFKLGYYCKLNYKIPICHQESYALYFDFNDRQLNNPFSKQVDGLDFLHFCLFPFSNYSTIFIFYKSNKNKYDNFFKNLNNLDLNQQLSIINFIIFAYSEDIFIDRNISKDILYNTNLQHIAQQQPVALTPINKKNKRQLQKKVFKDQFSLKNHLSCPNILDEKYCCLTKKT